MPDSSSVSLKATPWKIVDLANLKREGRIHLPDFQRGFVWSSDRVRALHDSLYRKYPVGALLLWKPKWEGEEAPCITRAWDIFPGDARTGQGIQEAIVPPQPGSIFVLDGQQRLTSIFRVVFQSKLKERTTSDPDLLVALSSDSEWVDEPFFLRSRNLHQRMRDGLLVPADVLFEGTRGGNETLAITKAIGEWVTPADELFSLALNRANAIRTSILQAEVIAYEIDAEADDDSVIEIFARLNQQGVRLRPSDLAAARLTGYMTNFREQARTALQRPGLANFAVPEGQEEGRPGGGLIDSDLLVRSALYLGSGLIRYRDVEEPGSKQKAYKSVEEHWGQAIDGFEKAVRLFKDYGVSDGSWLPYRYLILPPAIAAANGHELSSAWVSWSLLASLWRHYAGSVDTTLERDARLARDGDINGLMEHLRERAKRIESAMPEIDDFLNNIVAENGMYLALLVQFARCNTRSFPGSKLIHTADEPLEIHHIFPRKHVNAYSANDNRYVADRIGNLTLITRSDNEHLGSEEPKSYLPKLNEDVRKSHFIPEEPVTWEIELFEEFCQEREKLMGSEIRQLLRQYLEPMDTTDPA